MAGGDLSSRRRSHRLIKLKEASESEESRMIKLKREWRALLDRKMARIAAEQKALDLRDKDLVERIKARLAGAQPPPPPPCDPLNLLPVPPSPPAGPAGTKAGPVESIRVPFAWAPPPPPPCYPPSLLTVTPPPAVPAGTKAGPAGTKKTKKVVMRKVPQECKVPPPAGPAGTKKTKKVVMRKVPQECIDHMILSLRDPYNDGYPLERLRKRSQRFREFYAELRALDEKEFEYRQAIIKQFRQKGYAEDYSETEHDCEEVEEEDAEEN